jgi:hypothetical protein
MDTLETPTIEEEIVFLTRRIRDSKERIRYHESDSIAIPINKARIKYSTEKLKILQSLLVEQAAGWEIVFLQPQNDHDEVWKCVSPGPHITQRVPESQRLGNSDCSSESKELIMF